MHRRSILAALLLGGAGFVSSSSTSTSSSTATSAPLLAAFPRSTTLIAKFKPAQVPIPTLAPRKAAPDGDGDGDVSIPPVSIPPVSIPSLSLDLPTATCTPTIAPGKDGYLPPGSCGALWNYFPSFAAAVAFSVLFGVLLVAHIGQAALHHTAFSWVVIMASLWECASFVTRAAGSKDQQSTSLATVSQISVLLSPLWVNAYAYMVFARVVHFYSPTRKVWVLSPSILALTFVTLDFVSFIIQLVGGGMAGPGGDPETQKKGINIYMRGIGMQEGFIIVFVGLIVKFHLDQLRAERSAKIPSDKRTWRRLTYTLYACLLFISVRIIFRLIEFSGGEGFDNPLPNTESYFYGLDGVPMWLAIAVWNLIHPGQYMQGPDSKMPPSWLSRHLCCCCHRRSSDGLGPHQRLSNPQADEFHELRQLRPTNAWTREDQTSYNPGGLNARDSYRFKSRDSSRDASSERPVTSARPQRDRLYA